MLDQKIDTILMAMFPIGELRTSIPIAIHLLKLNWFDAFMYSLFGNSLIALILVYVIYYITMDRIKKIFSKIPFVGLVFNKWENSSIKKSKKIENWGYAGLAIFVSIPLPITGAWTAVLIASILELKPLKSFISITAGLFVSGSIITYLSIYLPNLLGY
tara:strand:+ start:4265 stop:4741 length:477 start_codon:yes stop_codon:yes gene_type:complete